MEAPCSYVLFRGNRHRTFLDRDMSAEEICNEFQVGSSRLYLTDHTNRAIFPEINGRFATIRLQHRCQYEVHGDPLQGQPPTHATAGHQHRPYSAAAAVPTEATQMSAGAPTAKKAKLTTKTFTRPICVSTVVDGKLFPAKKVSISIVEADASVERITAKVKAVLGSDEPLVLLNSKHQEVLDDEESRSLRYWTMRTRIIYAVAADVFQEFQKERMIRVSQRSVPEACMRAQNIILKIDKVKEAARGIPAITSTLNQLSELAKIKNTVTSLHGPMEEAFACPVCKGIMEAPMYAACCKSFAGCRACVRQWLLNANHCLLCREANFVAKLLPVNGLDSVLSSLKHMEQV